MKATTPRAVGLFLLTVTVLAAAGPATAYTGQELAGDAKITIDQARAIALKAHPGRIMDEELEREDGGTAFATRSASRLVRRPRNLASTLRRARRSRTVPTERVRSVAHGLLCASDVSHTNGAIMNEGAKAALNKVPEVTLGFWIIKILATTIGETGGDAVTMSLLHADKDANNGGYLIGTCLFMALFIAAVVIQIAMKRFHPFIYWLTIVATTTVGDGNG
jgi:hypothetical protein